MSAADDIQLNDSELSSLAYWDNFYAREKKEMMDNDDFVGEIWFDENGAEEKMVDFLVEELNEEQLFNEKEQIKVLDIGTGNCHLLVSLADALHEEYEGTAKFLHTGIDYSPNSIEFAQAIVDRQFDPSSPLRENHQFEFERVDLLQKQSAYLTKNASRFDVLLDKGTLDAIALSQQPLEDFDGKKPMNVYAGQVVQLMHKDSLLVITSCNFTEAELITLITSEKSLSVHKILKYPKFQFGGTEGTTITTVAFKKTK
ncbi:predicted protein [Scheffersomyces stipitis CBS 6054]|uniref:Protein-lysine N-methyltransferase EFM4 n=1 Tax=Scheffersomyces stipitis (strain ATCC 58785 / CBS 6054 / NBRC 10063 / NRRL Y-11545) TaxID=322104 RepID=A3LW39_PICST|nr:predicted protein [Scheffersomyces stipitis CBS 6054]ABN66898.1 predicted protein [Scheffersomyces stipitis CBS 6054]